MKHVFAKEPELKDKVRVFVKQAGGPHRSFYARVTHVKLNGSTVGLTGRWDKDSTDQMIEASEVVFREPDDLEQFIQFELGLALASRRHLFPVSASEGSEQMTAVSFAGDLGQKLRRRYARHPSIKIDSGLFKR